MGLAVLGMAWCGGEVRKELALNRFVVAFGCFLVAGTTDCEWGSMIKDYFYLM